MIRTAFPLALILIAGCARSEDASTVPADANALAVERVRTPDRDDQEVALGAWRESLQDDYRALEFGPDGAPPLFSIACDARRGIHLQRHGAALVGDLPVMLVSIGSETRRLAVSAVPGSIPMLRATLPPREPLLDRLAQASVPITIRIGDAAPLVLPPGQAVAAFITGCASQGRQDERSPVESNGAAEANEAEPAANEAGAR